MLIVLVARLPYALELAKEKGISIAEAEKLIGDIAPWIVMTMRQ